jgi:hypothetical protein
MTDIPIDTEDYERGCGKLAGLAWNFPIVSAGPGMRDHVFPVFVDRHQVQLLSSCRQRSAIRPFPGPGPIRLPFLALAAMLCSGTDDPVRDLTRACRNVVIPPTIVFFCCQNLGA